MYIFMENVQHAFKPLLRMAEVGQEANPHTQQTGGRVCSLALLQLY